MAQTAVFYDDICTYHQMGYLHPESPKRLEAVREVLDGGGVGREVARLKRREATPEELACVHDENYIKRIHGTEGQELVALDPDTSANSWTWEASCVAAGGFIECCERVAKGEAKNSYAFVRPPGHHAEHGRAMGFCFFNNVAIGAEWLIKNAGVARIAIIDFDVHHGNGTQHHFYSRSDVLFTSVHRSPFYPGSGAADETGEGEGSGLNLNVPLDAGADDDDYRRAIDEEIIRAVEKFAPDIVLVSAGYDAHLRDPLGGMQVTTEGHRRIMRSIIDAANHLCDGKVAVTLEGGYDLKAMRDCTEVQLEEMVAG
jgi:acetoin utilization deacetylase AcuC-like enzyme